MLTYTMTVGRSLSVDLELLKRILVTGDFVATLHSESMPSFNTTLAEEAGVAPSNLYKLSVTLSLSDWSLYWFSYLRTGPLVQLQSYILESGGHLLSMQLIRCFLSLILYGILCGQVCQWSYPYLHVLGCPLLTSPHSKTYTTSPFQRIIWRPRPSYIFSGWRRLFRLLPAPTIFSTPSVMILGTFLDLIMSVSYGSPLLFSLDLVRTYARTFTLWVTEIVVVGCIAQLFYAWRMYKFSKKARWLCITISVVSFLTKRLILLPKNTIFIKDRFCSIRGCDLLRHPSTEQWPLLRSSQQFEGQGDCNSEQLVVLFDI